MNDPIWFLNTAEGSQGPYTAAQLMSWLQAEQISPEWYVWRDGFDAWLSIAEVPELTGIAPPPAPPSPQPPPSPKSEPAAATVPDSHDAEWASFKAPQVVEKESRFKKIFGSRVIRVTAVILVIVGGSLAATKFFAPDIFDAMLGIAPPPPVVVAPPAPPPPPPEPVLDESMLPPELKSENVVILVIDGPRYSETWGDTEKRYIPNIAGNLAPLGVLFTNFRANGVPKTTPGHVAISTGHYEEIENNGTEIPSHPGIATIWLESSQEPESSAWIIATKDKLAVLAQCLDPLWKSKRTPRVWAGRDGGGLESEFGLDTETWREVQTILRRDHPRFVLINLKEPDVSGHDNNWNGYLAGLKSSDSIAWALWKFLESDSFYAGRTAYFVTNDHGRHLDGVEDGFVSHGDDCEGCRRIMLFAAGPDFARGVIVETIREQIDLAVTAARLMGVRLPGSLGKIIPELFPVAVSAAASETPAVASDTPAE